MTKRRIVAAAIVGGIILVVYQGVSSAQRGAAPTSQNCLKGVWRGAEIRYTGTNARTVTNPPWIVIFTDKHVASIGIGSDAPRPEVQGQPTDKDLADAVRNLTAYASTYQVSDGEFTRTNLVSAFPNTMRLVATTTFRCEGKDTLVWTQKSTAAGPSANPTTWKFVRLE